MSKELSSQQETRTHKPEGSASGTKTSKGTSTPDQLDPSKIRVVDVQPKGGRDLIRRDCYDPDGKDAQMGDVLGLKGGELWLRTVDWARSTSLDPELEIKWEATGLTREEIGQVDVFTWPVGEPVEVFVE